MNKTGKIPALMEIPGQWAGPGTTSSKESDRAVEMQRRTVNRTAVMENDGGGRGIN